MQQVAGRGVLSMDALPDVFLKRFKWDCDTGREVILGMSPDNTAVGYVEGAKLYDLSMEVYLPQIGALDYLNITNGVLTFVADTGTAARVFFGVVVTKVGEEFQEKGAAMRSVEAKATRMVTL